MNRAHDGADPLQDLIDSYLDGCLDEPGTQALEARLAADPGARAHFVRYARLHTDLHVEVRARRAGARALNRIDQLTKSAIGPDGARPWARGLWRQLRRFLRLGALASLAAVFLAIGAGWRLWGASEPDRVRVSEPSVAWLVNAQNCQWADGVSAGGDLRRGRVLTLARGLAEIEFVCGARVVLEGPSRLELVSGRSARLVQGRLTARAQGATARFEILSPQGKVIDLGTEFGVAVGDGGATEVYVFEGKVEALPADAGPTDPVSLVENEAARIAEGRVTRHPGEADRFVRAIVPPPVIVPRRVLLQFEKPAAGTIADGGGLGTGLTYRLPGTGGALPAADRNLRLDPAKGQLELTTTNSDLNTQFRLGTGEYLGVRLADLGFTGAEDFAVTVKVPNIPALESVGQFGLYAGARSDLNIRGGLISVKPGEYTQFLVNNTRDDDDINRVGLLAPGTDMQLTLKRTDGKYALIVENLTSGSTTTLTIRHPEFLDSERDLYVGLFGANTQSRVRKTLVLKEFQATVWTVTPAASR